MKDSTKDFLKHSLAEFQSANRDDRDATLNAVWREGYQDGAEVCLGQIARSIEELQSRLGGLSKDEQVVLSNLHELRRATREELGAPWSTPSGRRQEHAPQGRDA